MMLFEKNHFSQTKFETQTLKMKPVKLLIEVTNLLKKNETSLASKTSPHHAVAKHQDVVSLKTISMTNHPGNFACS